MKELIIGCGSSMDKRLSIDGSTEFINPVRLDYNADHTTSGRGQRVLKALEM
jgi:hypothetical protein